MQIRNKNKRNNFFSILYIYNLEIIYTYTFDWMLIHNNVPDAPQVERKELVEFKTTSTPKRGEYELQKFKSQYTQEPEQSQN